MAHNINSYSPKKFVWIRTGALGDLLVGTASLAELFSRYPQAQGFVAGPKLWLQILSPLAFPNLKGILTLDKKDPLTQLYIPQGDSWRPQGSPMKMVHALKTMDLCVDLCVNTNLDSFRYGWPVWLAKIPVRVGSSQWPLAHLLYTHNSPWLGKDPLIHERDRALLLLDAKKTSLLRPPASAHFFRAQIPQLLAASPAVQKWQEQGGLPTLKPPVESNMRELTRSEPHQYVLINPTSSRREKAWPAEKFRELALRLKNHVLILGSPSETDWLKEVAGNDFPIIQPPSIRELIDVLSYARLLITNTSSVQFIAASTRTPTLTLMGRTDPVIWGPLGKLDKIVHGSVNETLNHDIFLQEQDAYNSISVESVMETVRSFYKA